MEECPTLRQHGRRRFGASVPPERGGIDEEEEEHVFHFLNNSQTRFLQDADDVFLWGGLVAPERRLTKDFSTARELGVF